MKSPRLHLRKPGGFTLIELLVVISIIAMLATIGVAGGQIVLRKAKDLQAKATMKGLEIAIKGYKTEYLRLPSTERLDADNEPYDTTDESGRGVLNILLGLDTTRNPRQVRFWEAPPAKSSGSGYTAEGGLRDAWGKNGFKFILDYNQDGRIVNPYTGDGEPEQITTDVIIYSAGANGNFDESGGSGGKRNDDVKSWQ
jgi:prepilin-type N-terminal cleavage/methylation domain-containing protein